MAAVPPVVIPLCVRVPHTGPMSGSENNPNWKAAPIQKQIPSDYDFLPVLFGLDNRLRSVDEQVSAQHNKVPRHYRPWYGAEQPGHLGHKGHRNEDGADEVSTPEGGDAGGPDIRNGTRIDNKRHRSGDASQKIGHAGPGQRPLYLPKVNSPAVALGCPLLGNGFSIGLDGDYYAKEQKRREQGPEWNAEVQPQPGPVAGQPDPGRIYYPPSIVEAEDRSNRAAHDDTDYRPPKPQYRRAA